MAAFKPGPSSNKGCKKKLLRDLQPCSTQCIQCKEVALLLFRFRLLLLPLPLLLQLPHAMAQSVTLLKVRQLRRMPVHSSSAPPFAASESPPSCDWGAAVAAGAAATASATRTQLNFAIICGFACAACSIPKCWLYSHAPFFPHRNLPYEQKTVRFRKEKYYDGGKKIIP